MGAMLPSMAVNYAQAGDLGSLPFIGVLLAASVVGPFLDTLGAKPILTGSILLTAFTLAIMPLLHGFEPLAAAAVIYGFGGGCISIATPVLVVDLHAANRASALNLLGAFHSLGSISAPLMLSLVGPALSPTGVLWLLSAVILFVLAPILGLRFPPPQHAKASVFKMLRVLAHPHVGIFAVMMFFVVGQETCMFVWAGKVIGDALHVSPNQANHALAGLAVAMGAGRLFAIGLLKWLGKRRTLLLSASVTAIGALLSHSCGSFLTMACGFAVMGIGMSTISPTTQGLAGDRFPKEFGTVFGAIQFVGLVGGIGASRFAAVLAANGAHPLRILWIPFCASLVICVLAHVLTRVKIQSELQVLVHSAGNGLGV
jgi:fucose permease